MVNTQEEIDCIVARAIEDLAIHNIGLAQAILQNNYFVTKIKDNALNNAEFTLIDTTRRMTYDVDQFAQMSLKLYCRFVEIERWYCC